MDKDAEKALKGAGLRITAPRLAILKAFSKRCEPLRAEDVYEAAKHAVDLVTVYRALDAFEKAGIVDRVDLRKGSAYFELASHHHHHIVCLKCGKAEGFDDCTVESLAKKVLKGSSSFRSIDRHSLELFGVCKSCAGR